jgi:hypothetical protein
MPAGKRRRRRQDQPAVGKRRFAQAARQPRNAQTAQRQLGYATSLL